jgi:hypothetical protein
MRSSYVSLERFRTTGKYRDRPPAADIAFRVAAFAIGMPEDRIERALQDEYLSPRSKHLEARPTFRGRRRRQGDGPNLSIEVSTPFCRRFQVQW